MQSTNKYVSTAENIAEEVTRKAKHVLPTLARLCLIATFLEDGLRMKLQWEQQIFFLEKTWNCGYFLNAVFVIINLVFQIASCVMVLLRLKVDIACGMLFFIIAIQSIVYRVIWDYYFLSRNFALVGVLLLVLAEARGDGETLFAGMPSLDDNKPKTYLQLSGRILIAFMFVSLLRFGKSLAIILLQNILGGILMVLIMVGYRTKLSALLLVVVLTAYNIVHNNWWSYDPILHQHYKERLKYDFFQTLSVIGGVLMIVYLGPGRVSLDERKKNW